MITNIYRKLVAEYHWTLDQVYNLTHYQMYWFLNMEENVDTVQFDTVQDYREWLAKHPSKQNKKQNGNSSKTPTK